MDRLYFEETQVLRNKHWVWLAVIISATAAVVPCLISLDINGTDSESALMKEQTAWIMLSVIITITAIIAVWIYYSVLEIRVDARGLSYRQLPLYPEWKQIDRLDIQEFQVRKFNVLKHATDPSNKPTNLIHLASESIVALKLNSGRTMFIGTEHPDSLDWALRKIVNDDHL